MLAFLTAKSVGYLYLSEFDFRYTNRYVTDGARTVAGLKKVEDKLADIDGVISASLSPYETEDERDIDTARRRLAEIERSPSRLVRGDELKAQLDALLG